MYTFTVRWWVNGVKIEAYVNLDGDAITDIALEGLDGRLVDIIGEAIPTVEIT